MEDVTLETQTAKQLEETKSELSLALTSAGMGTFKIDTDKRQLYADDRTRSILGFAANGQLKLAEWLALVMPESKEAVNELIRKGFYSEVLTNDYRILPADGSNAKWIRFTGKVVEDVKTGSKTIAGVLADVTAEKEEEQRKGNFIAMVSHELKIPLTLTKVYLQMLQKDMPPNGGNIGMLHKAELQVNKMVRIIGDFLDVSRYDTGRVQLQYEVFDFAAMARDAASEAALLAMDYTFKLDCPQEINITADKGKIAQVLANLLSNAIKYSPAGSAY